MKNAYIYFILAFLYLPILILIIFSFNSAEYSAVAWEGGSLKWYVKLFHNKQLIDAAVNSLILAVSSAILATILGTLGAVGLYRYKFRLKPACYGLLYIVMMSPDVVMGISLLVFFVMVKVPLGFTALLVTHITFSLPFVVVTVLARMAGFDKFIVEAAKDLGAGEFAAFRHILLPMLLPAVIAGFLLSFTISLDDVIGSFFVTSPSFQILPLRIYSMVRLGVKPEINALSAVMLMLSLIIVVASQFLLNRGAYKNEGRPEGNV